MQYECKIELIYGQTMFYYRSRNDKEVDFVLRKGHRIIQKKAGRPSGRPAFFIIGKGKLLDQQDLAMLDDEATAGSRTTLEVEGACSGRSILDGLDV